MQDHIKLIVKVLADGLQELNLSLAFKTKFTTNLFSKGMAHLHKN